MKTKIYVMRVDNGVVIGFAKYVNHGLGSAILDAKDMSKREIEHSMKQRFYSQRHQLQKKGLDDVFEGFVFEWLNMEDVIAKPKVMDLLAGNQKPKIFSIEKKLDGSLKVNRYEGKLYDEDELKVALFQMAVNGDK